MNRNSCECRLCLQADGSRYKTVSRRGAQVSSMDTQTFVFIYKHKFLNWLIYQCSGEYLQWQFFRGILQSPFPEFSFNKGKVSHVWSTHKMSQWSKAAIVVDGFELVSISFCEYMHTSICTEHFVKLCQKKLRTNTVLTRYQRICYKSTGSPISPNIELNSSKNCKAAYFWLWVRGGNKT